MVIRLFFLAVLGRAAGLNTSILSLGVRRRIDEDAKFCPYYFETEETLLYNVDIVIGGVGDKGCLDADLLNIGEIIQKIVTKVESGIPKYKNEKMQTTICKAPVVENGRRGLREWLYESNRGLANTNEGRYIYKGGGKCRRCRNNNIDRRFLQNEVSVQAVCQLADKAIYYVDLAETAVKNVNDVFSDLKVTAMECSNLRSGITLVAWAQDILKECEAAQQQALDATQTGRYQCQQAKLASSEAQLQPLVQTAADASDTAMGAVDEVRRFYNEIQDKLATTDVCNQPIEAPSDNSLSVEGSSALADMAMFGVAISKTAAEKAKEAFLELESRAMECGDLIAGKQSIAISRAYFQASTEAKKDAENEYTIFVTQVQQIQATISQEELIKSLQMADEASRNAFLAAEKARDSYSLLRDELKRPICGVTERSPTDGFKTEESPTVSDTPAAASPIESPTTSPTVSPTRSSTKSPTASPLSSTMALPAAAEYDKADSHNSGSGTEPIPPAPNIITLTEPGPPLPNAPPTASQTRTPTRTPSASLTASPTGTATRRPTASPTVSPTRTGMRTATASPTDSPIGTRMTTPTATPTDSPTRTGTRTATASPTDSPIGTRTRTPTVSPTASQIGTRTRTPTASPTNVSKTELRPTDPKLEGGAVSGENDALSSPIASPTAAEYEEAYSPVSGSGTEPIPPVVDSTSGTKPGPPLPEAPPTASPTRTLTRAPSKFSASPTASPSRTRTRTPSASPSASPTETRARTPTGLPTASPTGTRMRTPTASPTATSPLNGSKTELPTVPKLEGGAINGDNEVAESTPLKQWLEVFVNELSNRIVEDIVKVYLGSDSCNLEGMSAEIKIDALERPEEEIELITKEKCDDLTQ